MHTRPTSTSATRYAGGVKTGPSTVAAAGSASLRSPTAAPLISPKPSMREMASATKQPTTPKRTMTSSNMSSALATSGTIPSSSTSSVASRGATKASASEHKVAAPERRSLHFSLDDLQLGATLGTGTFGRVRLAYHKPTRAYQALKILKKSEIIRLKQVDHIKSEIKILGMVEHPFIVNLLGHCQTPTHLYMLLEYVPGGELFSYLRRIGRVSDDAARFYAAEIVLAFQYLHSFHIVYRDLKPENLLITRKGHLKITDFGFAKVVEDKTWTLCGTPEYLAPEIIQSKGHGKSVDWWATGILIFEMLAGFPPFFDETQFGIYQKILGGVIDFPRHFDVKAKDLIRRLLLADRTQRLGCLRNGAEDIKTHRWFASTDWDAVFACTPEPPYIPPIASEDDTSNFDEYPESQERSVRPLSDADQRLFAELDSF